MSAETSSLTTVQIGTLVLTARDNDAPPDGTTVELVDGLSGSEQLGDDQLWPMLPTGSISFGVFAPDVDDVSISDGDGVRFTFATPRAAGTVRLTFDATVTDVSVRTYQQGVVYEVVAVDRFTGSFSEQLVGDSPWVAESTNDRVARIVNLCGYSYDETVSTFPGWDAPVAARDVDAQPALGLLTTLMAGWTVDVSAFLIANAVLSAPQLVNNPALAYAGVRLFPVIDPATLAITEWRADAVFSAMIAGVDTLPANFGVTGGGQYGVVMQTADNTPTPSEPRSDDLIDAAYVDMGARFTRRKGALPNTIVVAGPWGPAGAERTVTVSNGDQPPVLFRVATELTAEADAARAAATYLPDAGQSTDWLADAFVWRWYAEPSQTDRDDLPQVGDLVTVADIQDRHNPTGRPWYAGQLQAYTFKLAAGRPTIDLTIRPQLRRVLGTSANLFTWADLATSFPTVTWAQLNSRDTWDDYRLLRG